jgi:uncharacterized protein (DUF1684 family)
MSELINFRSSKDDFFANDHHSPLTQQQKHDFDRLEYYPENPDLRLELEVEEFPTKDVIEMQTSTGDVQKHTRYGKIHFEVQGEEVELTLYKDPHGYFLPFTDALAGKETYGAGRW